MGNGDAFFVPPLGSMHLNAATSQTPTRMGELVSYNTHPSYQILLRIREVKRRCRPGGEGPTAIC